MMNKMKAALDLANSTIAEYHKKELEMDKKAKKAKRLASLAGHGIDDVAAQAAVDRFQDFADEDFAAIVSLVAKMPAFLEKIIKDKEKKKDEKKKASDQNLDVEILETAEVDTDSEVVALSSVGDADTELQNTRAALVDFVYGRLGKTLNKGE